MKKATILFISLSVSLLTSSAFAQKKKAEPRPFLKPAISIGNKTTDVISHDLFDGILKKFVDVKGQVDYKALKKDREELANYVAEIAGATVAGSKDAKLAFYINAYNALVLKSIIDKKRPKSVMKIKGFFKKKKHKVAGEMMTLDHLENGIIRKKFAEPRIHFLLVCGAKSCPRLRQEAATEANIQKMMESATKEFVVQSTVVKGKKVKTSQIFNWFKEDFIKAEGSVARFLGKYLPEHAELLKSKKTKIRFVKYSWKLNRQ